MLALEPILIHKNIQPTAMRLLVLGCLKAQNSAMSLTQIELNMAPADRITIYRTLKTFQKQGLVHTIEDGSGATKFALCAEECNTHLHTDLHVHFRCVRCNETFCLPSTHIPKVNMPPGYQAQSSELIIKGTCAGCA